MVTNNKKMKEFHSTTLQEVAFLMMILKNLMQTKFISELIIQSVQGKI